ncbi:lycopene cyclase [Actinoplanes sp. OR16]|uniref:lycopene cyclase family protein n=1 Tax=Actinoplanes sp. OR16 TaxID=946334 RepID=UPI000F71FD2F|nr:lycopene cyclase family protein [Actinoplanes sp. OR16]BBH71675.1 lycopene cyclase [Actinoplanes sp. OR16]
MEVDLALVGFGGAAALTLIELAKAAVPDLRVATVDPAGLLDHGKRRTWAFWTGAVDDLDPVLDAQWPAVDLHGPSGVRRLDLSPGRYAMVRSEPIFAQALQAADRLGSVTIRASAAALVDDGSSVEIRDESGTAVAAARWVLDSRPARPVKPGHTFWLQHFRGWWVRSEAALFDPASAVLMDFRTPQPARGVSFGYVLPTSAHTALIEYTEFSPARLSDDAYDTALTAYMRLWNLNDLAIEEVEDGAIPMTDGVFERRPSARVVRIGTAGGATRPSTGYTFSAMRRQAREIAELIRTGRDPVPSAAYPRRHLWMDAVALHAWDSGLVAAPEFFERLFQRNPAERVLRFLDGRTTPAEEFSLMASTPLLPMMRAAARVTV